MMTCDNEQGRYPLWPAVVRGERDGGPVDLAAVQADDVLLDALARGGVDDDELARVLAAWRAALLAEPMPRRPGLAEAARIVRSAGRGRRARGLAVVAAALAVLGIAVAVAGLAAKRERPEGPLWPVTEVLWADQARSALAAIETHRALEDAGWALRAGQTAAAWDALDLAAATLPRVGPEHGRAQLEAEHGRLAGLAGRG